MDFMRLASERYSVRKFTNEHVSQEILKKILDAGHIAPTGCNYQPQRILVLNTDESIEKLKSCTKCHFNAPTALLVCYNTEECWYRKYDGRPCGPVDATIVTTHMMLRAAELGIGSTWVMHFDPAAMKQTFALPDNVDPIALLVMGHPAPDAEPLHLHKEFRPMEETVFYETF